MSLDLRPLSLDELFDRAFFLYRRNFWLFVGIAAVPGVFALVVTLAQSVMQRAAMAGVDPANSATMEANLVIVLWMVLGLMMAAVLYFVVYMVALGATTLAVSELYMGRTATIGEVYGGVRARIGGLLLLMVLFGLRLVGLFVLAIFSAVLVRLFVAAVLGPIVAAFATIALLGAAFAAAVFMALRYGLSVPALVLEQLSAHWALRRSVELTAGRLGHIFLLVVCATLVSYAALVLFQGPFFAAAMVAGLESSSGMWFSLAGAVSGTIGTTMTAPFMIIGLALLYYDARIRQEGFDLEVSLAALDAAADPARA